MEMVGNFWSNNDGSYNNLAFDSMSPSRWGHEAHFPELQDDLERALFGDGQPSTADLSMAEILHICMTSDEGTPDFDDAHLEGGYEESRRFLADFLLPPGMTTPSTPGTSGGQVSQITPMLQHAQEPSSITLDMEGCIAPMELGEAMFVETAHGIASSGWGQPVGETSPFVVMSEFVTPPLASSRHLSAQQLACLKLQNQLLASTLETTHGGAGVPGTTDLTKLRTTVGEQLQQFPVSFVSVRQADAAPEQVFQQAHRKSGPSPSKPLHRDRANAGSSAPADQQGPTRANALAPVTPDRHRKRRPCGKPRKVPKLAGPESAFQEAAMMQPPFLGIQAGGFVGGNANTILVAAPRDLVKAGDHVARERRRRDLMNSRYQTLESLLPPLPCRRDRFGIVEDTKLYVKEMEQKLVDLNKNKEECQTLLEAAQAMQTDLQKGNNEGTAGVAVAPGVSTTPKTGFADSSGAASVDLKVEVVMDETDQEQDVVVFAQCRASSGNKFVSCLLRTIEKLQLDVSQCSISKSSQFVFCSAVCKVQLDVVKSSLSTEKMMQEMVTTLGSALKVEGS